MNREALAQPHAENTPVLRGGLLQRKCACGQHAGGGECETCRKKNQVLQRKASSTGPTDVPAVVHDTLSSPGQRLDARARAFLEPRFDHDFSNVRVHTDAAAADSALAVGALAYTVGRHMVFGARQYAPDTAAGLHLMAHELSHVVQQNRVHAGSHLQGDLEIGRPDDAAEREADQVAEEMASGVAPRAKTGRRLATDAAVPSLQRQPAEDKPPVPHSLGMRPRSPSGFDALLQNDRIDSFLAQHKFAVGPKLQPSLDGQPTTLDAVIDAAVQPLVAPIPRSVVEDRVRARWQGMVHEALFSIPSLPSLTLSADVLAPSPNSSEKPTAASQNSAGTPTTWAKWTTLAGGLNYAWHVNLSGPPGKSTDSTLFLQVGEEGRFQRVFQVSYNLNNQQMQIVGGGQVTTNDWVLAKNLLKVNGFAQIVAGVASTGSSASGSFLLAQPSIGGQATLTFGPIDFSLQISPSLTLGLNQPTTGDVNATAQITAHF